jgi:hypothetical protein
LTPKKLLQNTVLTGALPLSEPQRTGSLGTSIQFRLFQVLQSQVSFLSIGTLIVKVGPVPTGRLDCGSGVGMVGIGWGFAAWAVSLLCLNDE